MSSARQLPLAQSGGHEGLAIEPDDPIARDQRVQAQRAGGAHHLSCWAGHIEGGLQRR